MKSKLKLIALAGLLCAGLFTSTAAEKIEAGPKGGRLLEKTKPRAEFFVEKDRTISINFYDASLKPVAPAEQTVTAIADTKGGKQKLDFEKKGDSLGSKSKLPEGDGYTIVVQLAAKPGAKPQNFRIKYDESTCGGCKLVEYACTCHD